MRSVSILITVALASVLAAPARAQPVQTEWHFNGDFREILGPSRLRFLDDPAFGPPPSGQPPGQTEALGGFGTTDSFDIPGIQQQNATVVKIPPPLGVNGAPNNAIGLALWVSNLPNHPDGLVDQFTIIMDILIPARSFTPGVIVPLINFDDNNGNDADLFIAAVVQDGVLVGAIGPRNQLVPTTLIRPDTWLRVSLIVDNLQPPLGGFETRMFVNGRFIGSASFAGFLFNMTDPDDPRFSDGRRVSPDLWDGWGRFPSPWALSTADAPMLSTCTLFADDNGEGRLFYMANLFITDFKVEDTFPTSLDDPDPCRIVLCDVPCAADFNNDCTGDVFDLLDFLDLWFMLDPTVDLNFDLSVDVFDLLLFLQDWFAGC